MSSAVGGRFLGVLDGLLGRLTGDLFGGGLVDLDRDDVAVLVVGVVGTLVIVIRVALGAGGPALGDAGPAGLGGVAAHATAADGGLGAGPALLELAASMRLTMIVMWQVRLRMRVARPRARGRQRLSVGPSSA